MNHLKVILIAFVGSLLVSSCKTPNIAVSNQLKENTDVYEVKGRQGWQFNQVIRFGEYNTSKIKRGWSLGYDFPFAIRFQGAKEKLSYQQNTPFGKSADVFCIGKFKNTEIPILGDFFGISLQYEDYFAGSVKNNHLNWDFVIYEPDGNSLNNVTTGEIVNQSNKSEKITIKAVKKIEGQSNWVKIDVNGFEFIQNGKAIGAVSLLNNGRVWLSKDLSEDKKLLLTSVMSGLMVRHNMSEGLNE